MSLEKDFKRFACASLLKRASTTTRVMLNNAIEAYTYARCGDTFMAEMMLTGFEGALSSLRALLEKTRERCTEYWEEIGLSCEMPNGDCECDVVDTGIKAIEDMIKNVDELLSMRVEDINTKALKMSTYLEEIDVKLRNLLAGLNCTTTIKSGD